MIRGAFESPSRRGNVAACAAIGMMLLPAIVGCGSPRLASHAPPSARPAAENRGRSQFTAYCAGCHQPDGKGSACGPPPLADSSWIKGSQGRLIRIVLGGVRGPIEVGGKIHNLEMPPFGPILSDQDVADVLTYARRRFGGPQGPVTADAVADVRAATADRTDYWTSAELMEIP